MDIDLLSKMVKELLLDNDTVILPGLGSFVAEVVPSTFSDKGYTINPPYRKLYFRSKPDEGYALVDFYSSSNKVDRDIAERVICQFVDELKKVLFVKKTVVFPGLGRLRATKENAVFFVADEDLDIYPEGFALQPVSLKTHVESPAEVAAVVEGLKSLVDMPVFEDVSVPEQISVPVSEPGSETSSQSESSSESTPESEKSSQTPPESESDVAASVADGSDFGVEAQETEDCKQITAVEDVPAIDGKPADKEMTSDHEACLEPIKGKTAFWKVFAKSILWIAIIVAVLLGAFILAAHLMPDFIDGILYTPDELDIINREIC